jgi:hypothetical protein
MSALWSGALGSPVSLAAFVCGAQCAAREPELERTFGTLDVANYTLRGLLRLCKAATVPSLVRVRGGVVEVAHCVSKRTARNEMASSMRLLAGVARAVRLPDVVFGFDSNDYAVPQGRNPLKYASEGWNHVLPGVVRLVAVDSHPVALFPTSPAVRDAGLAMSQALQPQPELLDWDAADASLFWRGGSTGIPFDADFMWHMPRLALGRVARGQAGLDVGMTTSDGVSREMEELGIREQVKFTPSSLRNTSRASSTTSTWMATPRAGGSSARCISARSCSGSARPSHSASTTMSFCAPGSTMSPSSRTSATLCRCVTGSLRRGAKRRRAR